MGAKSQKTVAELVRVQAGNPKSGDFGYRTRSLCVRLLVSLSPCLLVCRLLVSLSPCLLVCLLAGCGGPRVVPVSGTATVDGKPLAGFVLTFTPDAEKGHEARVDCSGRIGGDGKYSLRTDDGFNTYHGAPPGWYKVTIWSPDDKTIPVNKKYTDIKTTDLAVEVVANPKPGAYDFKFTK